MVQKFPGKVSRNSESCWKSEMRTIQPKALEIAGANLMERNLNLREKNSKILVYLAMFSSVFFFF